MKDKIILVVDDSKFDRELITSALSRKGGGKTLEASCGEECLEILKSQKVDLVLIDIIMPGTFGTQILVKIREKFNALELPIIMVTSKSDVSDVVNCLKSGANDYITKPVNFDVALSRISTHLKLAEISSEMSKLKEMAALDAMITTYNHEINNPLAIALGNLDKPLSDPANIETLKASLWRIANIVKKIREVTNKKEVEYGEYGRSKMVNLKY